MVFSSKTVLLFFTLFGYKQVVCFTDFSYQLGSSDFSEIVNNPWFLDKSLMIKEVLKGPNMVLSSAPHRFGKSSNLNMLRRFVEIPVNEHGVPKNLCDSANYKLFSTRKLKIFKLKEVCDEHFGQYAVLHIDYLPLEDMTTFESMLDQYRTILMNTFEEHLYLIENQTLWSEVSKEQFIRYIHPTYHSRLSRADIRFGFKLLLKLLFTHYGKKVFILVDNYNSHIETLLYQNNPDIDILLTFIHSINRELFNCYDYIFKVFVTGTIRTVESSTDLGLSDYCFLGDHPISVFYGLLAYDVNTMLNAFGIRGENGNKINATIEKYYNGYLILSTQIRVYSIWSTLNYLCNKIEISQFRCKVRYFSKLKHIVNTPKLSSIVKDLISNKCICRNVLKPFSTSNVTVLNEVLSSGLLDKGKQVELFLTYLYQLGYLAFNTVNNISCTEQNIWIPNKEVLLELENLTKQ